RESRGEELRLFYVALTRARDTLLLVSSFNRNAAEVKWEPANKCPICIKEVISARSPVDWLLAWLPRATANEDWRRDRRGEFRILRWGIRDEKDSAFTEQAAVPALDSKRKSLSGTQEIESFEKLKAGLAWDYPFLSATTEAAKTSVSTLRRRLRDEADDD